MSTNKPINMASDEEIITEAKNFSDDDLLKFSQGVRKRFINTITKTGFPEDPKEQRVLLQALSDMDKQSLGNKAIGASEKQSESDLLVARALSNLGSHFGTVNPFEGEGKEIPKLEDGSLPVIEIAPGETDVGLSDENYDGFMKKFEDKNEGE
jgi:hypothetical protein